ncbi:MAG: tail fiber domain-containing protein [Alphaproteobacteria bacterium]
MTQLKRPKLTTLSFLILFAVDLLAFSQLAQAVLPPPDGGYPGFTTAEGSNALNGLTTGLGNTGVGWYSLFSVSDANYNTGIGGGTLALNNGDLNTAIGAAALLLNTAGSGNTAVGTDALLYNDSGSSNNAVGAFALFKNIDGEGNNAFGGSALSENVHGALNTAMGDGALFNNDITSAGLANFNTAVGGFALYFNTDGDSNTAIGYGALENNDTGSSNTATGVNALYSIHAGFGNTACGFEALRDSEGSDGNTAVGIRALLSATTGSANVAIGGNALLNTTTGNGNIALGGAAGQNITTGNSNIEIDNFGNPADDHTIRIGNVFHTRTFIGGIRGVTTGNMNAVNVLIDSDGQLGTMSSSRRYKKDIQPMEQLSEVIHALKPVMFHYKTDSTETPQFGLIAEEVAEVNPDLVVRDDEGDIYTVRYDAVNAMLLNEFLKEHRTVQQQSRKIQEQDTIIAELKSEMKALAGMVNQQGSELREVTTHLQIASPQMRFAVENP